MLKVWQTIDGANPELSHIRAAIDQQLAREQAPPTLAETASDGGVSGTIRVDPPQEAAPGAPAAGAAKRRSGMSVPSGHDD